MAAEGVPFGRYAIIKRLATGGMAEVFLAKPRSSAGGGRLLVLKRMLPVLGSDPELARMFLDEARIAAQLAHPYVVQVFDVGEVDRTLYIAMEYVHGVSLEELLGKVPWEIAARIGCQVCEALQYAHEARSIDGRWLALVHRDVTPSNIMLTYAGGPKLLDFGIARASQRLTATRPGVLKGKLSHASPEQFLGQPVDLRTDLYGLGVSLYELVGGALFPEAKSVEEAREMALNRAPQSLARIRRDVPKELARALTWALSKKPEDRPQSARQFREALEACLFEKEVVVGMPEVASWLESVYPGRGGLAPLPDDGFDSEAETVPATRLEGTGAPRPGSTQPLSDQRRAELLRSLEEPLPETVRRKR